MISGYSTQENGNDSIHVVRTYVVPYV